jgi:hypothetical protein
MAVCALAISGPVQAQDTNSAPAPRSLASIAKSFATVKRQETESLASKLSLSMTPEIKAFFEAAEAGDTAAVSNRFHQTMLRPDGSSAIPNILWIPIHETLGLYELVMDNNPSMSRLFAERILGSMPEGSIYFGGTDAGRFLVTGFDDTAAHPRIMVMTQNQLADTRYAQYLQTVLSNRVWVLTTQDSQQAFQEYVADLQSRTPGPDEVLEIKDGHATVRGVTSVMAINGLMARMIFEHNKDKHEFYVEESYPIQWMYPYVEPHGVILKLNSRPLNALGPDVVARDRAYWDALTAQLKADTGFAGDPHSQKAFAKLRAAIGSVYVYRKMDSEAEYAFTQALALCPTSPEGLTRLASLRMAQGRADEAKELLSRIPPAEKKDAPMRSLVDSLLEKLRHLAE